MLLALGITACEQEPVVRDACVPPDRPDPAGSIELEPAFPGLGALAEPLWITQSPLGDGRFYVLEKGGRAITFTGDGSDVTQLADFTAIVDTTGEGGLLFLAFDPDYATTEEVYITYLVATGELRWQWRLSRFTLPPAGPLDMASEERILVIDKVTANHNGASLVFGMDGFLYVSVGDGGSAADDGRQGQDTSTLFGSVLRIDVRGGEVPYGIPPDNPFVGGGGRPEIWAYGLRNPWRMHADRVTDQIWLGDVGEGEVEEVDMIRRGGNYGWNIAEGDQCFWRFPDCDPADYELPVATFSHSDGDNSVTGGFVYRGEAIPELVGSYVFGDFRSGRIRALVERDDGGYDVRLLLETDYAISSFGQDAQGELYVIDFIGGEIFRIVPGDGGAVIDFPERLRDIGCMDPLDPSRPGNGMIPYSPIAHLYADGAIEERWMSLPADGRITVGPDGDFDFPAGTVLVKNLRREGRLLETRFLIRHLDGEWAGYTYVWNDAQTEARLARDVTRIPQGDRTWLVPSRTQCNQCHTEAAGRSLGLELAQLDHDYDYPDGFSVTGIRNQLEVLRSLGVLDEGPGPTTPLSAYASDDSLEARARSYLHANCSHCHRPGAPVRVGMDMRRGTALADTGLCRAAQLDNFGVPDIRVIEPGVPTDSVLVLRMRSLDYHRMPIIGSLEVDDQGVGLVEEWITSLASCP